LNGRILGSREALFLNNVAYATLLTSSEPNALQRAYDHARRAFRMAPWLGAIRGTWGAVLVETGDVEQGLACLTEAAQEAETPRAKAANLAYAAIGHHRLGRRDEAAKLLEEARGLGLAGNLLNRAEVELSATPNFGGSV
jgi:tetratricopeptide (TPR) repeat protein